MLENSGNETSERYLVIVFKRYTVKNKCNFTPHLMAAELPHIFWFKYFNCFIENYFCSAVLIRITMKITGRNVQHILLQKY